MFKHQRGSVIALMSGVTIALCSPCADAQEARLAFDIPRGPAATAVAQFARQAKVVVLASGDSLAGITTNEVRGSLTVPEALERLLYGTGFVAKPAASGALFIVPKPAAPLPAAATPPRTAVESETLPDAPPPPEPLVVTVPGTRAAMISGIEHKKFAVAISDAIVAEDIGQFPDKNIGEALSRITGVQIASDFGEGNEVAIRGVQPDLNRIEINGMQVLSTADAGTRAPELRDLPSELIKSIEVIKGTTADTTEGGLGGTVSIRTNRPLDFNRFTLASTVAAERNSLRGGTQPRGNLLIADRFLDGRLGLMANLVYDKVLTQADRVRNSGWRFLRDWDFSPEKTLLSVNPMAAAVMERSGCAALAGTNRSDCERQWYDYSPSLPRYGLWTRDHARRTGEFSAQYQLAKDMTVYASFQRFNHNSTVRDRNLQTDFSSVERLAGAGTLPVYDASGIPSGGSCQPVIAGATPPGVVVSDHRVTEYVVGDCVALAGRGGHNAVSTQARDFRQGIDAWYRSAGLTWRGGAWSGEAMLASSDAAYRSDTNFVSLTMNAPGLKVSLDERGFPHLAFPAGASPEDSARYTQAQVSFSPVELDSFEDQVKLDLRYRTGRPLLHTLRFGVQGRRYGSLRYADGGYVRDAGSDLVGTADDLDVRASNVRYVWNVDPLNSSGALRPAITQPFIDGNSREIWVDAASMRQLVDAIRATTPPFLQGAGLTGFPSSWVMPDYTAAAPFFDTSNFTHDLVRQAPGRDGRLYPQIPTYHVEERVRAAYLRADFEFDIGPYLIEGNAGVRYAGTHTRSVGRQRMYRRVERTPGGSAFDDRLVSTELIERDSDYRDFLPSLNAALWLRPDQLVLRAGLGKVMARPSLDRLSPNFVCIIGSGSAQFGGDGVDNCTGGNPELKPYRAFNTDLSLEWYPARATQLSVAYFRKDIRNAIQNGVTVRKDLLGDGRLFDVTGPVNARGATTAGVELAGRAALNFLPGVLAGLGVDASFTRMSYSYAPGTELINRLDRSVLPFPGMSRSAYNLSVWYDRGPLNARLAYNRRSGYYTGLNDSNTGNPLFEEGAGFLDAKLQWRLRERLSVSLEAKNLTDTYTLTTAGAITRPNEYSWSGRRYFLGIEYKY